MAIFNEFPQTNFHELNLDWIIAEVKRLASEWADYNTSWEDYQQQWQELQDYITNYFESLNIPQDIHDEVARQLDLLVSSGGLVDAVAEYVPAAVTDWISTHASDWDGVVDDSLTIQDAAADAWITGRIRKSFEIAGFFEGNQLDGDIGYNKTVTENDVEWTYNNGKFTAVGTATGGPSTRNIFYNLTAFPSWFKFGVEYEVNVEKGGSNTVNLLLQIAGYKQGGSYDWLVSTNENATFKINKNDGYIGMLIRVYVGTGNSANGYVIPHIKNGTADHIARDMKMFNIVNLLPPKNLAPYTENGVDFYTNDGVYTAIGTATTAATINLFYNENAFPFWLEKGKSYPIRCLVSGSDTEHLLFQIAGYKQDGSYDWLFSGNVEGTLLVPDDDTYKGMLIRVYVGTGYSADGSIFPAILNGVPGNEAGNTLKRKFPIKAAFFGDSLIMGRNGNSDVNGQYYTPYKIPDTIAQMLNIECDNFGVSGQGYMPTPTSPQTAYDNISSHDISNYDYIFIEYGGNDGFSPIGSQSDSGDDTIMGVFNQCIHNIYNRRSDVNVVVFAPMNGRNVGTFPKYWYGQNLGGGAYSRQDLSNALKQRCEYYGIPYIEQTNSPINGFTIQSLIGADGVHPSNDGYKRLGEWHSGELLKIIG